MSSSVGPRSAQQGAEPVVSQSSPSTAPPNVQNADEFNGFCNTVANLSKTLGTEALQPQITALQNATTALQRSIAIGKQSIETQQEKLNRLWADLHTIQGQQPSPSTSHTAAEQIQLNSAQSLPITVTPRPKPTLVPRPGLKPRPLANPFDCPPPALENVFATIVPPSSPNSVFSGGMSDPELDALMEIAAGETEVAHSRPGTPQIASAYNPWGFVQDTYTTQVKQLGIETIDSWFEAYQTHAFNLMLFGHELSTAKQQDIATTLQGARNTVSIISEPQTIQTLLEKLKTDLEREVPGIDLTPIQLPTATPSQPIPIPVASLRRQPDPSVTFNPPPGPGAAKEA